MAIDIERRINSEKGNTHDPGSLDYGIFMFFFIGNFLCVIFFWTVPRYCEAHVCGLFTKKFVA